MPPLPVPEPEEAAVPLTAGSIAAALRAALDGVGAYDLDVRWEPGPRIARVEVALADYTWDTRDAVLRRVLAYEAAHAADLAVEVEIVPLPAVAGLAGA